MNKLFGPVMQNAFVVDDLETSIDHWARTLGVGPFFVFEHIQFQELSFRGRPLDLDMTAAIAYWGDVQIELIRQHNDVPSIYSEFTRRGLKGLQHMGVMTDNLDAHLERLAPLGITPVQRGQVRDGARVAYVSTDFHPGTMIELIETGDTIVNFFNVIRDAAAVWDGKNPIHRV